MFLFVLSVVLLVPALSLSIETEEDRVPPPGTKKFFQLLIRLHVEAARGENVSTASPLRGLESQLARILQTNQRRNPAPVPRGQQNTLRADAGEPLTGLPEEFLGSSLGKATNRHVAGHNS